MTITIEKKRTRYGRWRKIGKAVLSVALPFKGNSIPIPMRYNDWGDASGGPYRNKWPRFRSKTLT